VSPPQLADDLIMSVLEESANRGDKEAVSLRVSREQILLWKVQCGWGGRYPKHVFPRGLGKGKVVTRGHQDRKKVPRVNFFPKASRGELIY